MLLRVQERLHPIRPDMALGQGFCSAIAYRFLEPPRVAARIRAMAFTHLIRGASIAAALFTALAGLAAVPEPAAAGGPADLVARGEYVARLGDCVACHTAPQ